MTGAEVIQTLNSFTSRIEKTKSFEQWEALDAEKHKFWDGVDEKTKELSTVQAANKKFEDKMIIWSIVLAN